jgi:hypothetical protein
MLGEVGIDAEIALVRTRGKGKIDYELPSLGLFNHAIAYVPDLDGNEYWLDGTAQYYGFDELPFSDQGVRAFTVADGKGKFRSIELGAPAENTTTFNTEITLLPDGSASGTRSIEYEGQQGPTVRFHYRTTEKARDIVERSLNRQYPGARVDYVNVENTTDLNKSPSLEYSFVIPEYAKIEGDKITIKPCLFPNNLTYSNAMLTKREYDLLLSYPYRRYYLYKFNLPREWAVEEFPEDARIRTRFGNGFFQYETEGREITFKQELTLGVVRIAKEEYQEFRAFCNSVDKKEDATVILRLSK